MGRCRAEDLTLTVVALLPTNKIRATRDATTAKVWRVEEKMKRTLHPRCWTKAEHYQVDLEFTLSPLIVRPVGDG